MPPWSILLLIGFSATLTVIIATILTVVTVRRVPTTPPTTVKARWVPPILDGHDGRSGIHPLILRQLGLEFFKLGLEGLVLGFKFTIAQDDLVLGFGHTPE